MNHRRKFTAYLLALMLPLNAASAGVLTSCDHANGVGGMKSEPTGTSAHAHHAMAHQHQAMEKPLASGPDDKACDCRHNFAGDCAENCAEICVAASIVWHGLNVPADVPAGHRQASAPTARRALCPDPTFGPLFRPPITS